MATIIAPQATDPTPMPEAKGRPMAEGEHNFRILEARGFPTNGDKGPALWIKVEVTGSETERVGRMDTQFLSLDPNRKADLIGPFLGVMQEEGVPLKVTQDPHTGLAAYEFDTDHLVGREFAARVWHKKRDNAGPNDVFVNYGRFRKVERGAPVVAPPGAVAAQPVQVAPAQVQPVYQQPVAVAPVMQQPMVQQPVYQQPVVAAPVATAPVAVAPVPVPGQN